MTTYHSENATLSEGQMKKLAKAYKDNSPNVIQLSKDELTGPHQLLLTKTQIQKLQKAKN